LKHVRWLFEHLVNEKTFVSISLEARDEIEEQNQSSGKEKHIPSYDEDYVRRMVLEVAEIIGVDLR